MNYFLFGYEDFYVKQIKIEQMKTMEPTENILDSFCVIAFWK